ncbi:hypothetical protein HG535_0G02380 [Zygotorulaspora mrakii]|uniref:Uncharacterized protein n=1 Tax=Zygotorulaspora mrakii TaxID=42260 RepID=A0A7H9B7Y3_ZYGMR|nr:uncharacterized protein HG535_0G02380 [Zygotorulaspora mrakii]QLG74354.1 hypothetical protein HG535_0G02380 [Zygotorulaspora mrakii]
MDNYSGKIEYRIEAPFFIIKLSDPGRLNSLAGNDYLYLAQLLEKADEDDCVYFTVLQSSGRFFSSGADYLSIGKAQETNKSEPELNKWLSNFVSRNVYVTDMFTRHRKILICCLNGPAIGLSAALCALCDIVYSMNENVYLLFPFASLGLVTEGATSVTLPLKLGNNATYQALMFNEPIKYDKLKGSVITKNYGLNDTEKFNTAVMDELRQKTNHLYLPSILGIKKLLMINIRDQLERANAVEVNDALKCWVKGEPQKRFKELSLKQRKHKL